MSYQYCQFSQATMWISYVFALTRDKERKSKGIIIQINCVIGLPYVTVGVNGKLSQETTEMTTGASLISLLPYQAPCPRYKCHLSHCDWDRKPSRASCHKHRFGILQKPVSLFWGLILFFSVEVSLSLTFALPFSSSTPTHMHMGTHTHAHAKKKKKKKCSHLWRTTLSLRCS